MGRNISSQCWYEPPQIPSSQVCSRPIASDNWEALKTLYGGLALRTPNLMGVSRVCSNSDLVLPRQLSNSHILRSADGHFRPRAILGGERREKSLQGHRVYIIFIVSETLALLTYYLRLWSKNIRNETQGENRFLLAAGQEAFQEVVVMTLAQLKA